MKYIENFTKNPYLNLATEEFLLRNSDEDFFRLWICSPAVICGKNQNLLAEHNYAYVLENEIAAIRRISGGGAVYHDEGNLNFSFIQRAKQNNPINFTEFTQPIVNALHQIGIESTVGKTGDLRVGNFKISGNAVNVFKNRILQHGTLLFNANLNNLSAALKSNYQKYSGKAVQSIRTNVMNISSIINKNISIESFIEIIIEEVVKIHGKLEIYKLQNTEFEQIEQLAAEKYNSQNWNFGYSPEYCFENRIADRFIVHFCVEKQIITKIQFYNIEGDVLYNSLSEHLLGKKHCFSEFQDAFLKFGINFSYEELFNFF